MVTKLEEPEDSSPHLLRQMLVYLDAGYSVLPLIINAERTDLGPAISWRRFRTEKPDVLDAVKWFQRYRVRGIAVALGLSSSSMINGAVYGLACRHFANGHAYRQWACEHKSLAVALPTTRGDGFRVYGRASIPNMGGLQYGFGYPAPAGSLLFDDSIRLADGHFLAGSACLSPLPPTLTPAGECIQWIGKFENRAPTLNQVPFIECLKVGWLDGFVRRSATQPGQRGAT